MREGVRCSVFGVRLRNPSRRGEKERRGTTRAAGDRIPSASRGRRSWRLGLGRDGLPVRTGLDAGAAQERGGRLLRPFVTVLYGVRGKEPGTEPQRSAGPAACRAGILDRMSSLRAPGLPGGCPGKEQKGIMGLRRVAEFGLGPRRGSAVLGDRNRHRPRSTDADPRPPTWIRPGRVGISGCLRALGAGSLSPLLSSERFPARLRACTQSAGDGAARRRPGPGREVGPAVRCERTCEG